MDWSSLIQLVNTPEKFFLVLLVIVIIGGAFKFPDLFALVKTKMELGVKTTETRELTEKELSVTNFSDMRAMKDEYSKQVQELRQQLDAITAKFEAEKQRLTDIIDGLTRDLSGSVAHLAFVQAKWEAHLPHIPFPVYPPSTGQVTVTPAQVAITLPSPPQLTAAPETPKKD